MRLFLSLLLILLTGAASATTINFEGVVGDDGTQILNPSYTESGFTFSSTDDRSGIQGKDVVGINDSAHLFWCGVEGYGFITPDCLGNTITLSHETDAFSLQSFVGGGINFESGSEPTLIVSGQLVGGGTLIEEIDISSGEMQTILMGSAWTNLESVSFQAKIVNFHCCSSSFNGSIDDIVVTAVPLPASVWLFGSALAGLGWLRRKKPSNTFKYHL